MDKKSGSTPRARRPARCEGDSIDAAAASAPIAALPGHPPAASVDHASIGAAGSSSPWAGSSTWGWGPATAGTPCGTIKPAGSLSAAVGPLPAKAAFVGLRRSVARSPASKAPLDESRCMSACGEQTPCWRRSHRSRLLERGGRPRDSITRQDLPSLRQVEDVPAQPQQRIRVKLTPKSGLGLTLGHLRSWLLGKTTFKSSSFAVHRGRSSGGTAAEGTAARGWPEKGRSRMQGGFGAQFGGAQPGASEGDGQNPLQGMPAGAVALAVCCVCVLGSLVLACKCPAPTRWMALLLHQAVPRSLTDAPAPLQLWCGRCSRSLSRVRRTPRSARRIRTFGSSACCSSSSCRWSAV